MQLLRKMILSVEQADETELWMLPYSTFMLTLVILFIVFYSYSSSNSIEYETALSELAATNSGKSISPSQKEIALAQSIREFISKGQMADKAAVIMSAQFIKLKMESPALFDSGSAVLKTESLPMLEQMTLQLKNMDNTIIVEGHTDNVPMRSPLYKSNWELSAARAFSVIRYFIGQGIEPRRLIAHGFGEFRPTFQNDTDTGRAKNRRIEITIVRGASKA